MVKEGLDENAEGRSGVGVIACKGGVILVIIISARAYSADGLSRVRVAATAEQNAYT